MGAEATLKLLLLGEDRSAGKVLRGAGKDADRTGGKFAALARNSGKLLAGGLLTAAAAGYKFVEAAAEDQKSAALLAKAMRNGAHATDAQIASTERFITTAGKQFGVVDDDLRPAMANLVRATGSVSEAQELASLAMEVSAGTGKSLAVVSRDLAKASLGTVTGLKKYQVETKNADGTTKSFAKIQQELSDKFKGSAAASADTLSGKMQRLNVAIQEGKEAIGAKLLPVISDFVEGMEDGTGAGGDFRDVLEDTVAIGKGAVQMFQSIPGPVKKYGAELAVAAVVMSKMNTGLIAARGGLTTLSTSFATAGSRSAKFGGAMRATGGALRNVAGAGGMLLLADSADKAGTSMGALEAAAGGALTGAALGAFAGPPGAAIGAAIGGIAGATWALSKETDHTTGVVEMSLPSYKEYANTLRGVSAAISDATREMAYQRLESTGLGAVIRELGLSDREAVNAMLGKKSALEKLNTAIQASTTLTLAEKLALIDETGAVGKSREAQLRRNIALAKGKEATDAAREALRQFMREPANKRIGLSGVGKAKQDLHDLIGLLQSYSGLAGGLQNAGPPSGLGGLLGAGSPRVGSTSRTLTYTSSAISSAARSGSTTVILQTLDPATAGDYVVRALNARGINTGQIATV